MLKQTVCALYILVTVCMGLATFIENSHGTAFVAKNIYGAWWFSALWAALTAAATSYFVSRRVRWTSTVMLHASLVVILGGALLTHLTSHRGMIHLRQNLPVSTYTASDADGDEEECPLPFTVTLDRFEVTYHEGTTSPADYRSHMTIAYDGGTADCVTVSMNNIFSHRGIRLYQSDYDNDMRGSVLAVNADPWGIPVTYTGYAMLFISLLWMLLDPRGSFRKLLNNPLLKKASLCVAMLAAAHTTCRAATTLSHETAEQFGRLHILYNGRICQVQTLATDFTKKIYGRASYHGYTAEQVLAGFILWPDEWSREPLMRMKDGPLKEALQLPDHCPPAIFFNSDMGGYILGQYVMENQKGCNDKFHREVADTDDRLMMIMQLRHGSLLKIFPVTANGVTTWLSPADSIPHGVEHNERLYIKGVLSLLAEEWADGRHGAAAVTIDRMRHMQQTRGGGSLPTAAQDRAERIYNAVPFATILFMFNLTIGLAAMLAAIRRMTVHAPVAARSAGSTAATIIQRLSLPAMCMSLCALTVCVALRWIVSGTIPMSNGYETMLFAAWTVMVLSTAAARRFAVAPAFGLVMSGFFLLVAHIGGMDPDITHIMPVLNSPLLCIHVSVIMISFAMLSVTFICGVTAMAVAAMKPDGAGQRTESLMLLSRLFLYPAIAALAAGIFIGAVWANVSWGQYWGWDPKEVWALITLMVYSVATHTDSLPALHRPMVYHAFMTAAFLTVLMTYFGVNYILGGMHSYA